MADNPASTDALDRGLKTGAHFPLLLKLLSSDSKNMYRTKDKNRRIFIVPQEDVNNGAGTFKNFIKLETR